MKDEIRVQGFEIPPNDALDRIQVFLVEYGAGKGAITVACCGNAWTAYFGAMCDKTIREFVSSCGVEYLVNQILRQRKRGREYLALILIAVKAELEVRKEGDAQ